MSSTVEREQNTIPVTAEDRAAFVTAKEAAKFVSYSPDYISKLARDGKVAAVREGRQWLVSLEALKHFSLEQQAEQRARQQALREDRLREYAKRSVAGEQVEQQAALVRSALPAGALTLVVTSCVGLIVFMGWLSIEAELQPANLWGGAADVAETVAEGLPFLAALTEEWSLRELLPEATVVDTEAELVPANTVRVTESGVEVVPDTMVSDVVSDQVEVAVVSSSTIILEPVFLPAADAAYTLQLAPVVDDKADGNSDSL